MTDVNDFLKRSSSRNGFSRDRFEEQKIPTDPANITVGYFFGDIRTAFVLSSLLLKRYREEKKGSKYFILCSWPGLQGMFPYVDEYWSFSDHSQIKRFYEGSDGLRNSTDLATIYFRNLNEFFRDVVNMRELENCYLNKLQQGFWDEYKHVKRFLPQVPSAAILGKDFNRRLNEYGGYKVFIAPTYFIRQWHLGKSVHVPSPREFWVELVDRLIKDGFVPVVWNHYLSHDISEKFTDKKCVFFSEWDISKVMGVMRSTGCVLDVYNGTSRFALAARCPYLALDERQRYVETKEFELDDLCGPQVPKQYIFSFSTIITEGNPIVWNADTFNNITNRLNDFLPGLSRDQWPSTSESEEMIKYDVVRKKKVQKIGARLLKITRD
jgi:hypothetical protein